MMAMRCRRISSYVTNVKRWILLWYFNSLGSILSVFRKYYSDTKKWQNTCEIRPQYPPITKATKFQTKVISITICSVFPSSEENTEEVLTNIQCLSGFSQNQT